MDAFRKQLDDLMGRDRDTDTSASKHFSDPEVCKFFLVDLCPAACFAGTKMDNGPCPKLHSLPLKAMYDAEPNKEKYNYEAELERKLDYIISECDHKIVVGQRKLEEKEAQKHDETDLEVKALFAQAEVLGEEGRIDESRELLEKAEQLKGQKIQEAQMLISSVPSVPESAGAAVLQLAPKLKVCDICASFLSSYESDKRLADHFGGKLHISYLTIREKLAALKEARRQKGDDREILPPEDDRRDNRRDSRRDDRRDDRGDDRRDRDYRERRRDRYSDDRYSRDRHRDDRRDRDRDRDDRGRRDRRY